MSISKKIEAYIYNNVEKVHLYRTIAILAFSFFTVNYFKIPHGSWVCITVVVLLGPYPEFGGIIHRVKQRILGTIAASISGVAMIFFFHNNLWMQTIFLIAWIPLMAALFKKYPYSYLVCIFTVVIVLGVTEDKTIDSALWRVGNIMAGGLITLIFSLIFPVRGIKELRLEMAESILMIDKLYTSTIKGEFAHKEYLDDMTLVFNSLRKQRKTYEHVTKESKHFKLNRQELENITVVMRKMSSIVELLNSSTIASEIGNKYISQLYSIQEKRAFFTERMQNIAKQLKDNTYTSPEETVIRLTSSREELDKLYQENDDEHTPLSPYSYVWLNYQYGLQLFKLEQSVYKVFNN
ncbi:FUSC family protein [Flammeovirga yaeyamensis]|uniref:FUSC family protein n=1 Tax=Flammeovirga yaeyamensis TaxID=367791 RepID=A0AAX1N800_9BACT|nr:FUSC family protein [Flammeovirga yaeyamensis]MBB3699026.1 putative membrane protein YccC [Flammeovirga yaeyamensis]NMF36460.1 FUSC family protein [Flammeovirga yaeyamensis]QWG03582.1 FUSC family protein [Flammeovirga yaeyamensis]